MTRINRIFVGIAICGATFAMLLSPTVASAKTNDGTSCGKDLTCVKTVGDGLINNRIKDLNAFVSRVQSHQFLTDAQKQQLVSDAQTNISGLTTLKGTLDGETDITKARIDVHNIFQQFRIYAIVLPRDTDEVWTFHLTSVQTTMASKESDIQTAINNSKLTDKTQANNLLADYTAKLNDAAAQVTTVQGLFPQLTPANYDANPTGIDGVKKTIRGDLDTGHSDVKVAYADLLKIRDLIKDSKGQ
jgi:hypothetical protein